MINLSWSQVISCKLIERNCFIAEDDRFDRLGLVVLIDIMTIMKPLSVKFFSFLFELTIK